MTTLAVVGLLGAAGVGYVVLAKDGGGLLGLGGNEKAPPICPLTGEVGSSRPAAKRPALGVKIENIAEARPQAGLNEADVIYEEPVEGGITRFVAVFQCQEADRLGPVRSARFVDPEVMAQFGVPLFAYSGGIQQVIDELAATDIVDVSPGQAPDAYLRDPNRAAPHDLYSSTDGLYAAGKRDGETPEPIFTFARQLENKRSLEKAREVNVNYSGQANVFWQYDKAEKVWLRSHDGTAHTLEDGSQIAVTNVIVQLVEVTASAVLDAAGNPSPEVEALGQGTAYVFRGGRVIEGTWERGSVDDVTRFLDAEGNEIALAPGTTWIHLFPQDGLFSYR